MRTNRWVGTAVALVAALALAAPNTKLANAKRQFDDLELEAATKSLAEALAVPGNDRATLLEIYRLQGVAWGTLGKSEKSRDAFKQLLVLDPAHTISADQPPRVRTPFYEAKEWATRNGPLALEPRVDKSATAITVVVSLKGDAFNLARVVVFHLRQGDTERTEAVKLEKGLAPAASVTVQGDAVKWWAELLGERESTLLSLGTSASPFDEGPKPVVRPDSPPPPPPVVVAAAPSGTWLRPAGIALMGAGVVAGGVGAVLGLQAQSARSQVTNPQKDERGVVTSITQRRAEELDATARNNAVMANVLFGVGGGLAATGLVLTLVGGPAEETSVTLAPVPGGVTVSGRF